jgi:hypothetical protein
VSARELADRPAVAPVLASRLGLVDAVDHLLNRGALITGEATVSLAGVDLVYLRLSLLLSSVETLRQAVPLPGVPSLRIEPAAGPGALGSSLEERPGLPHPAAAGLSPRGEAEPLPASRVEERVLGASPGDLTGGPASTAVLSPLPEGEGKGEGRTLSGEPVVGKDDPARSLARLILTLVEALRQILERQSLRRAESGVLPEDVVEQLGTALLDLESKMADLRRIFDLREEDLNVDLGPLGQLL